MKKKTRNILINFVPVKSGGGLQNALSFLDQLPSNGEFFTSSVVVCENQHLYESCKRIGIKGYKIKPGFLWRLWFELFYGYVIAKSNKTEIIFTLFGNGPLWSPKYYKISGFAFSNILQPEVPFWDYLPLQYKYLNVLKDRLRLWAIRRSDEIILETEYLYERAKSGPFKDRKLHVVKMEPSSLVSKDFLSGTKQERSDYFRFLVLSGPQPNKRIEMLAPIFSRLKYLRTNVGLRIPCLLVSLNRRDHYSQKIANAFCQANASDCLSFIGPIPQEKISSLLNEVDCMVNIARLESFSNNWVEAWSANIPLVATDADWARASCGNAAIYINPEKPEESADTIFNALTSVDVVKQHVDAGKYQLSVLGEVKKIDAYYSILNDRLLRTKI